MYDKSRIEAMVSPLRELAASNVYAECPLLNANEVFNWARTVCPVPIPQHKLHCTVLYSRDNVDLTKVKPSRRIRLGENRGRKLMRLGEATALVLDDREARPLRDIWRMFNAAGASWDFPSFIAHISISYDWNVTQGELNLINAYEGPLEFGPYTITPIED